VVCSLKELCDAMDRYLIELHEYIRVHSSPYEAFAHAWVDCNRRLLNLIDDHPDACVSLRYEDLLDDAPTVLKRVLEFLDEPADVDELICTAFGTGVEVGLGDWKTYATKGLDKSSVGRGNELPEDSSARLAAIINPTMQALGYDAVAGECIADRKDAIRRHRATCMVKQMLSRKSEGNDG
jgi:hypothetical protein